MNMGDANEDNGISFEMDNRSSPVMKFIGQVLWVVSLAASSILVGAVAVLTLFTDVKRKSWRQSIPTLLFEILVPLLSFLVGSIVSYCIRNTLKRNQNKKDILVAIKSFLDLASSVLAAVYGAYHGETTYGVWHKLLVGWVVAGICFTSSLMGNILCQRPIDAFTSFTSGFVPVIVYFASEKRMAMVIVCAILYVCVMAALILHYFLLLYNVHWGKRFLTFGLYFGIWVVVLCLFWKYGKGSWFKHDHPLATPPPPPPPTPPCRH